ncbi:UDP-N-acetylglucosamine pyrophosphorylase [Mobilicoccus pelagius]|uniref:UDP-N-acetylglucosamine pyrophosphorylase n=1 Tax=Mobilicoccus pelagius NBRC 104925 TaxID=1089455 RepID=H5USP2_9MICO|nr:UDP-N-acetylglucosamine pyrophosphorylase [Mobilicoccus pelagius]GAB48750.1 hypothetical protein MOPEL_080_00290 [Mobilicoccus pelagius NBRC 104925]
MTLTPRGLEKVETLIAKGTCVPNPWTVTIDDDVDTDRISGDGVTIHPGCRIRGAKTVISAGVELGREGPVAVEDCRLGPGVALKGGYAAKATFLDGANLGLGHHVREGCLLEEQSGGAHTVGLKQTILFPYVTLGSIINFCDAFMAGGTSRSDHSEVGSSYIHFNFTPTGDKTTPSLFGDVPRGVTLREKPIFLGGQGGSVGPVQVGYGSVVGAGSVLRGDVPEEGHLVLDGALRPMRRPYQGESYRHLAPMVRKNLGYLAQLDALEAWYRHARAPFFEAQELGTLVLEGALETIASARKERASRLTKLAGKLSGASTLQTRLTEKVGEVVAAFGQETPAPEASVLRPLTDAASAGTGYLAAVHGLDDAAVTGVQQWLTGVVEGSLGRAHDLLPELTD